MTGDISSLRQQLWRSYNAMKLSLRQLQRSEAMVQGSFYLLRRKCGKPNCRCAQGQLHTTWVLTRSEQGQDRLYSVPKDQRGRLRPLTQEYRRYQRARAVLVKRHWKVLQLVDHIAELRMTAWPPKTRKGESH